MGRPTGRIYELRGAPIHSTEEMLSELISQTTWQATIIPGWRRVTRGHAVYRARSDSDPPWDVLRTSYNQELIQIQIAKTGYKREAPSSTPTPPQSPMTWEASARLAVGVQRQPLPENEFAPDSDFEGNDVPGS